MVFMLSDVGNTREINEDFVCHYEDDRIRIYVIADGMGGHNAGDVAAKLASEAVVSYVKEAADITDPIYLLQSAFKFANDEVFNASVSSEKLNGMGTTLTVVFIYREVIHVGHVGDSSCFAIKGEKIKKITKDHSFVQYLIDTGSITKEQAKSHPRKNLITRAIWTKEELIVDTYQLPISLAEYIVLSTDGLTNYIDEEEICDLVVNNSIEDACTQMINISKERGGKDNITVLIVGGMS